MATQMGPIQGKRLFKMQCFRILDFRTKPGKWSRKGPEINTNSNSRISGQVYFSEQRTQWSSESVHRKHTWSNLEGISWGRVLCTNDPESPTPLHFMCSWEEKEHSSQSLLWPIMGHVCLSLIILWRPGDGVLCFESDHANKWEANKYRVKMSAGN